jgi:hypothetical protein
MQLEQAILGVLTPTDLPLLVQAGPCKPDKNGHQGDAEKTFNQGKAFHAMVQFSFMLVSMRSVDH